MENSRQSLSTFKGSYQSTILVFDDIVVEPLGSCKFWGNSVIMWKTYPIFPGTKLVSGNHLLNTEDRLQQFQQFAARSKFCVKNISLLLFL